MNKKSFAFNLNLITVFLIINFNTCLSIKNFKNVLFIVADDLGWSDFGFEDTEIQTPNIDYLSKTGVLLNQAYSYSTCTPYLLYLD